MRRKQVVDLSGDDGQLRRSGLSDGLSDRFVRRGRVKSPVLVQIAAEELVELAVTGAYRHNGDCRRSALGSASPQTMANADGAVSSTNTIFGRTRSSARGGLDETAEDVEAISGSVEGKEVGDRVGGTPRAL